MYIQLHINYSEILQNNLIFIRFCTGRFLQRDTSVKKDIGKNIKLYDHSGDLKDK